jgi:hypothetical protein
MIRSSLHLIAVTMLFLYPSDGYIILPPFPKLFLRQPIEIFDAIGIQVVGRGPLRAAAFFCACRETFLMN